MENVNNKTKKCVGLAMLAVIMVSALAVPMMAGEANAEETPYDEDMGTFQSMAITVMYNPPSDSQPAETITWNFGDGSEDIVAEPYESVRHVYQNTGVYYITQTATNSVGSNTATYKVEILGYPTVTYVFGHDIDSVSVQQSAYNTQAEFPSIPDVEGYTFAGWYTDSGFTTPYNTAAGVTGNMTLYANYLDDSVPQSYTVQIYDSDGGLLMTVSIPSGEKLNITDIAATLLTDNRVVLAGLYTDNSFENRYDNNGVTGNIDLYAKTTPVVPEPDDYQSWIIIGLFAVGIIAFIGAAVAGSRMAAVIGILAVALAALLHLGVIPWII